MPKFSYVAMDSRGKETKGTLEVGSQNEAIGRLKEMGYFPTKVIEVDKSKDKDQGQTHRGSRHGRARQEKRGVTSTSTSRFRD